MTRSLLKATTALSICLSVVQPVPAVAQVAGLRGGMSVVQPQGDARVWTVQTCAEDPTLADCPPPAQPADEGAAAGDPGAVAPGDAQAAPEAGAAAPDEAVTAPAPTEAAPAAESVAPADTAPPAEAEAASPPVDQPTAEPVAPPPPDAAEAPAAAPAGDESAPADAAEAAPVPSKPSEGTAPVTEAVPAETAPPEAPATPEATVDVAPESQSAPSAPAEAAPEGQATDAPAEAQVTATEPVPAPDENLEAAPATEPTPEQAQVLDQLLADPDVAAAVETLSETVQPPTQESEVAPTGAGGLAAVEALGGAALTPAETTTQTLGAAEARSSTQDFTTPVVTAPPAQAPDKDKKGLSDLEKAGLLALGAVAVGMLINNNRVVANSGDRVVVDRGNGDLAIWKDDNANLRSPGVVETTDRYADGSTLTRLARPDGSQIVTVRDATGRVLRRDLLRADGTSVPIIDDTRSVEPVRVSQLPKPRVPALRFGEDSDPALLKALLDEAQSVDLGRTFSLAQVRDTRQLRELAPELTGAPITFATGSSAIRPEEARKLAQVAGLMRDLIDQNPAEVFLIEGHTDAVGGAASNLALSDRRAESVALALSEIFGVPPENMIVQGYGERFLKVPTLAAEPLNRRVALRRITWLLDGTT